MIDKLAKIGGKDNIVEIYGNLFSRRKISPCRVYPEVWMFGGISRELKKVFVVKIENRNSDTLINCIEDYGEPCSTRV